MSNSPLISLSRRQLLLGVSALVVGGGLPSVFGRGADQVVFHKGWLLSRRDFA